MDDRLDLVAGECGADQVTVGQAAFDQRTPLDGPGMAARQVVEDHRVVSGTLERLRRVTADVSCTAGDQNLHVPPLRELSVYLRWSAQKGVEIAQNPLHVRASPVDMRAARTPVELAVKLVNLG